MPRSVRHAIAAAVFGVGSFACAINVLIGGLTVNARTTLIALALGSGIAAGIAWTSAYRNRGDIGPVEDPADVEESQRRFYEFLGYCRTLTAEQRDAITAAYTASWDDDTNKAAIDAFVELEDTGCIPKADLADPESLRSLIGELSDIGPGVDDVGTAILARHLIPAHDYVTLTDWWLDLGLDLPGHAPATVHPDLGEAFAEIVDTVRGWDVDTAQTFTGVWVRNHTRAQTRAGDRVHDALTAAGLVTNDDPDPTKAWVYLAAIAEYAPGTSEVASAVLARDRNLIDADDYDTLTRAWILFDLDLPHPAEV